MRQLIERLERLVESNYQPRNMKRDVFNCCNHEVFDNLQFNFIEALGDLESKGVSSRAYQRSFQMFYDDVEMWIETLEMMIDDEEAKDIEYAEWLKDHFDDEVRPMLKGINPKFQNVDDRGSLRVMKKVADLIGAN